jgi:uncharacterized membrane protein
MRPTREITPVERGFILFVDRLVMFITRRWLLLVILALAVFAGLPFLAPVLMSYGITGPAEAIYRAYGLTCHQLSYRTFFFFGAQPGYTIDQLQSALHVTNPASDLLYWRAFLGNSQVGFKMSWCERDTAIYTSMVFAAILFALSRRWLKPLDWRIYLLVFVAPMAFDGFWQLFTSPTVLLPFLPVHESSAELRVMTGALFGSGSIWLIFPYLDASMRDAYADAKSQYRRGKAHQAALNQDK